MGFLINSCPPVRPPLQKKGGWKKSNDSTAAYRVAYIKTIINELGDASSDRSGVTWPRFRSRFFSIPLYYTGRVSALSRVSSSNDLVDNPRLRIFLPSFSSFPIFPPFVSSLRSLIFIAHQLSFNSHRYLGHVHFWTDFLCIPTS